MYITAGQEAFPRHLTNKIEKPEETADGSMAKLICSTLTSLDGYIEDEHGGFDWSAPDDEVFSFVNELESSVGTYHRATLASPKPSTG
jgi:hypothetical protein